MLLPTHDDTDRRVTGEQHGQAGDRRGHHVGELVGRAQLGSQRAAVARRSRASCSSGHVAHGREHARGPAPAALDHAHPHRADDPAARPVPQRRLDRTGAVVRARRRGRRHPRSRRVDPSSSTSQGYGRAERPVVLAPAQHAGEPVVDLEHGAVEVEDEQGVVQAVGDGPAPRGVLGASPGPLEVARDPGPQLQHREGLDEVVVGAGSQGRARLVVTGTRREEHDRHPAQRRVAPDGVDEAVAVEARAS